MNSQNLATYLLNEKRPFDEAPLSDVDLMAFAALMYAEFERFGHFSDAGASTPIGELPLFGKLWEYVEHDCNPDGMLPLVEAMVGSPRFADVRLECFRCIVDEARAIQFAAGCFPLSDRCVVVAYRGTDTKLVGWQEDFELMWQAEGPGEAEAVRFLVDAANAYPGARLLLCGHSKGGAFAEHAAVYAPNELLGNIERAVSFDGPALFRLGEVACPEFGDLDDVLLARYDQLPFPVQRYIFPSMVGLMFERRDPARFTYTQAVDEDRTHNICSARIIDGRIAASTPTVEDMCDGMLVSRWVRLMSLEQRRFTSMFVIDSCRKAGISIDLADTKPLMFALARGFFTAGPQKQAQLIRIAKLLHSASEGGALS